MSTVGAAKKSMPWWGWVVVVFSLMIAVRVVTPSSTPPNPRVSSPVPTPTPQADFDRVNGHFLAAVLPCQLGFAAAQAALHSHDQYYAYEKVQRAKPACMNAYLRADAVSFSEATPQPHRDTLNKDLKACGSAYAQDAAALDSMASVLNGDTRPSAVSEAGRNIQIGAARVGECMATYVADAKAAGLSLPGDKKGARRNARRRHGKTHGA